MTSTPIARAQPDAFESTLQLWGRVYGVRLHDDEPRRATHAIAVAMETGAKSSTQYAMDAAKHRTRGRREFMARDLGGCGVRIVPASYVDPVPCKGGSGGITHDPNEVHETPVIRYAQAAWLELHRMFPIQAKIVAMEYQRPDLANQSARAAAVGVVLKRYERELERARHWMRAGLAMAAVVSSAEIAWSER